MANGGEKCIGEGESFIIRFDGFIYIKFLCVRWMLEDSIA
jgi:hypothetical protein